MKNAMKVGCMGAVLLSVDIANAALPPGVESAKWLTKNCGSAARFQSGQKPDIGSAAEMGSCVGYLGALAESALIMNQVLPPNAQVCTTGPIRPIDLAVVVLEYIKKRPAVANDPRLVVSLAAMADRFPCPKQK